MCQAVRCSHARLTRYWRVTRIFASLTRVFHASDALLGEIRALEDSANALVRDSDATTGGTGASPAFFWRPAQRAASR